MSFRRSHLETCTIAGTSGSAGPSVSTTCDPSSATTTTRHAFPAGNGQRPVGVRIEMNHLPWRGFEQPLRAGEPLAGEQRARRVRHHAAREQHAHPFRVGCDLDRVIRAQRGREDQRPPRRAQGLSSTVRRLRT